MNSKTLKNYAELIIKLGVNLQPGQGLEISCPVEKRKFAHILAKTAYDNGAKIVKVRFEDEQLEKLNYERADVDTLLDIPKWFVDSKNYLVEKGFCYVAISAEDPSLFKKIDPKKLFAVATKKAKLLKKFSDAVMNNQIRWCVVSVPTLSWAKQVFPGSLSPEKELSIAIEKAMRLDDNAPLSAWEKHVSDLQNRSFYLNQMQFEYLHFTNGLGTDLRVGLAFDHVWLSAMEKAKDGVNFLANMPTEEVFTAPHRLKVDGVLKGALPLCVNGQIIDGFSITFKKGKITSFDAKKGYSTLKQLIETDGGTKYLGEVALIGKNSPIAKSNILFYNTLFDENASCHLAIGKAYPTTVKNGDKLSLRELKEKGLNDSVEHVDFMIGTPDLKVVGILKDGTEKVVFLDGEWAI